VRLEGSLDAFSLPDIFSLLSMTKKTGGLHLRRPDSHGAVWLADGQLTGGASDLTRASLGRRIAGSGAVDDDALTDAVARVADDPEVGIARALRDAEDIEDDSLRAVVAEHIVDTVFDLLRWEDGDFEFVQDEPNADDVGVTRPVDDIVTEARARLESWSSVEKHIPTPDTVLAVALAPDSEPSVSRDDWALLALVDGRRTVADIVELCGRGEYSVVVALAELVSRELLEVDKGDGVSALTRRQQLLGTLENSRVSEPEPELRAVPDPVDDDSGSGGQDAAIELAPEASTAPALTQVVEDIVMNVSLDDGTDDNAPAQRFGRQSGTSRDLSAVTPQRPEPFIPQRAPDHPEPALAVGGGVATAAATAHAIERDPSVNKSLLLRLIAGVRGL
jgi:hypothetical protein